MCGIFFGKKSKVYTVYDLQRERGTDGIGIISPFKSQKICELITIRRDETYKNFIDSFDVPKKSNVIMHHRKASMGTVKTENTHPFVSKRFFMVHNGTCKESFAIADFLNVGKKDTDSETILSVIESQAKDLKGVVPILDGFSRTEKGIGTILLVEKRTNIILFYSDGERASFIKMKEWSANEKIHSISNIDDDGEYDHKSIGHIFFKFDGTILEKDIQMNIYEKKKVAVTYTPPAYTYGGNYGSYYGKTKNDGKKKYDDNYDYGYDDYWRNYEDDYSQKKNEKEKVEPLGNSQKNIQEEKLIKRKEATRMIEALYTVGDIACPKCLAEGSVYIPKPNTYMCTICKVDMVDFLVNDADQDEYDFFKSLFI